MEHSLNVALIEPEIPQNTGNIARTCAATGARLHLVGPMGFQITERRVRRAGLDYWDKLDITYYDDINDFLKKQGRKFLLFHHQGGAGTHGCRISKRLLPRFRQGIKGLARAAA